MSKQMLELCPLCGRKPHTMLGKKSDDGMQALIIACPTGHVRVACINHDAAVEEWNTRPQCSAVSAEPIPACKNCMHKGSHLAWRCDACGFEVERSLPNEPQAASMASDDPIASKEWNDGCDFAMTQLCKFLDVEPSSVSWDAATDTVEGDVSAVIGNILRAKFGEDWGPQCQAESAK